MQAIDTPESILGNVHNILNSGFHGIVRYISPNTQNFPKKQLTAAEVAAIHSVPGMRVGMVYETNSDHVGYFTAGTAANDAAHVLAVVAALNVPVAVPAFFAVDFDALTADLNGPIKAYFKTVHDTVKATGRLIGVYGSGNACSFLHNEGTVHYTWLAQSRGWGGYAAWKPKADVIQGPATKVAGLDVDTDFVVNEEVLW